jgi:hypothetical protein
MNGQPNVLYLVSTNLRSLPLQIFLMLEMALSRGLLRGLLHVLSLRGLFLIEF